MFVEKRVQNYHTKEWYEVKNFDVYTDWYQVLHSSGSFRSRTKLDRYELPHPSLNTPAVVCLEAVE